MIADGKLAHPVPITIREFGEALWKHWFTAMSGGLSVPLTVASFWVEGYVSKVLFVVTAFLCVWAAAYSAWKGEREARAKAEQQLATHLSHTRNGWFRDAVRYGVFGRWPQNESDLELPFFSTFDGSTLSDEDAETIKRAKLVLRILRQAASDGHLAVWGYSNPRELILGAKDSDEKTLVKIDAHHRTTYTVDVEDVLNGPGHVHTKMPDHLMFDEGSYSALKVCTQQGNVCLRQRKQR